MVADGLLPSLSCALEVNILLLHRRVDSANRKPLLRAPQDRASKNDRKSVLRPSVRVGQTSKGVWAVGMRLMIDRCGPLPIARRRRGRDGYCGIGRLQWLLLLDVIWHLREGGSIRWTRWPKQLWRGGRWYLLSSLYG